MRLLFDLPPRQTEGFVGSLLGSMDPDLESSDHTTLSCRAEHLEIGLRAVGKGSSIQVVVSSTGLQIVGQVPWSRAKNGQKGTREWRKLNVGVDQNGVIVAEELTDSTTDDASVVPALVRQVPTTRRSCGAPPTAPTTRVSSTRRSSNLERLSSSLRSNRRVYPEERCE